MQGQMLWFNEVKDHGFIRTDEGERLAVGGTSRSMRATTRGRRRTSSSCPTWLSGELAVARPVGAFATRRPLRFAVDAASAT